MPFFKKTKTNIQVDVILPPLASIQACLQAPDQSVLDNLQQRCQRQAIQETLQQRLKMPWPYAECIHLNDKGDGYWLKCDIVQFALDHQGVFLLGKPPCDTIMQAQLKEKLLPLLPPSM